MVEANDGLLALTVSSPAGGDLLLTLHSIRKRLDWDVGILNEPGENPKGMHWRTYERLQIERDAFVSVAFKGMAARLGLIDKLQFDASSIHKWLP